jgi:hypothetical protein
LLWQIVQSLFSSEKLILLASVNLLIGSAAKSSLGTGLKSSSLTSSFW